MRSVLFLLILLSLTACQSQTSEESASATVPQAQIKKENLPPAVTEQAPSELTPATDEVPLEAQAPPSPPMTENFQGKPLLSLFPRAGAFRPELDDTEGLQYWRTFIDHLMRTSGPHAVDTTENGNITFAFRAIKGIDSVGLFSPLAVKPATSYRVSTRFNCDLAEGATAGIGLLEFDKFQWVGEQYPESVIKESQLSRQTGVTLKGKIENQLQTFTFTTGPKTGMVHLVFFRDGEHDRNPVSIDDISITEVQTP